MDDPIFDPWPIRDTLPVARRWVVPTSGPTHVRNPLPRPKPAPHKTLQSVARPRLEEVQARLQIAGHGAVLADLTDREPPSLRLRFTPRRGAFDVGAAVEGAVLELTTDREAGHAVARFWLDPLAEECTEEVTAPSAGMDTSWVERVVLDFVGRALRAGF